MADAYVYYFMEWDSPKGINVLSTRRATLEAIKGKGEPVMETQTVVDETQLDDGGFFPVTAANSEVTCDAFSEEITSLELRADSRDREALSLDEASGEYQYMLQLESRELRRQVKSLQTQRVDVSSTEPDPGAAPGFVLMAKMI